MNISEATEHNRSDEVQVSVSDQNLTSVANRRRSLQHKQQRWWVSVSTCIFLVLAGQSFVKLLQNFYYVQDGRPDSDQDLQYSGTWMQALLQNVAFPIFIPFLFLFPSPKPNPFTSPRNCNTRSCLNLLLVYVSLGVLVAAHSKLYALGKLYVNYGIFSWICATQLIFTSIFAAFINKFRFNRWIIISIILTVLAFAFGVSDFGGSPDENEEFYDIAAWLTFFGNVAFSLSLCLMQLGFEKVMFKKECENKKRFKMVFDMQVWVSLIASVICVVGLFASGEFKDLRADEERFGKGRTFYVLSLVGLALSWQLWSVGLVGLVFLVSCIFSNVVSMCVSPLIAVFVVYAFRFMDDEFGWVKRAALLVAVLGFSSYIYWLHKRNKKKMDEINERENAGEAN